MVADMFNWLMEIITLPRIIAFILGMAFCQLIGWYVDRRRVKQGKPPKASSVNAVIGTVIVLTMVWIMVSTQQARNCALTVNTSVTEAQRIDGISNDSFQNAIKESLPYSQLPDDERRRLTQPITDKYLATQAEVAKMREANRANQEAARKACGQK